VTDGTPAARGVPDDDDTAAEHGRRTADLPPELFQHWIHSREDDQDDVRFFRREVTTR
jgi:hypothetical protein